MDAKKNTEKAKWELHNTICFFRILEATLYKTAVVWLPTSDLTNHPCKNTRQILLEKQGQTHKQHSLMNSYTWTQDC